MTTPATIPTEGTILKMALASVMTEIGLVEEIDGPIVTIADVETTHLTSTLHTYRPSKIPTPENCTGKIQLDPNDTTMHKLILDRIKTPGTIDDFEIDFIDTNTTHAKCTFSGFWKKCHPTGIKTEQNLMADFEIKLTTVVTYTVGVA